MTLEEAVRATTQLTIEDLECGAVPPDEIARLRKACESGLIAWHRRQVTVANLVYGKEDET